MERDIESYHKISPTAKLAAFWKAQSDIPWAKEIADAVGAKQAALQLAENADSSLSSFSVPIMEARYKSINVAIEETGLTNVMEAACGLSPRGLELAAKNYHYLGSDLPGISAEVFPVIRKIAENENIPEENLQLQPVNILDKDQLNDASGYFNGKPFVLCNEGLLMYFNRQEKEEAAKNIRDVLHQTGGAWITTDLAFHEIMFEAMDSDELDEDLKKNIETRLKKVAEKTGRDFRDNWFSGSSEASQFYEDCGFSIREIPMRDGSFELSTLHLVAPEARKLILNGLSVLKVWILEVKE